MYCQLTLISGEIFRASKEDLQKSGVWFEDAIALEHGGYLSGLGVMHELHCLVFPLLEGSLINEAADTYGSPA